MVTDKAGIQLPGTRGGAEGLARGGGPRGASTSPSAGAAVGTVGAAGGGQFGQLSPQGQKVKGGGARGKGAGGDERAGSGRGALDWRGCWWPAVAI